MNPLLSRLQPYPFERLRKLQAGVTPSAQHRPISLGIGEPRHAAPDFLKKALADARAAALTLLVIGGLIYTAGVFVFISPTVKFRRAIWHGFVVTGATVHWAAVLVGVVLAPAAMG